MSESNFIKKAMQHFTNIGKERLRNKPKKSFSQSGEDLIIDYIFTNYLRIHNPSYLDIGANHPTYLSNTYHFYKKGSRGVCVEPDKSLFLEIQKQRREDICLNVGVGFQLASKVPFYVMSEKTLNTFSSEVAERNQGYGYYKIQEVTEVDLLPIDEIISRNFSSCPNFISLDVEGLDFQILKSMDFIKFRPEVFCIETLTFVQDKSERKLEEIIAFMQENGYFVYADTFINTIFVDNDTWHNRQ
jgi:FkbM family methyltransferase